MINSENKPKKKMNKENQTELSELRKESRMWETRAIKLQVLLPCSLGVGCLSFVSFVTLFLAGVPSLLPIMVTVVAMCCAILGELLTQIYWKNHTRADRIYRDKIKQTLETE